MQRPQQLHNSARKASTGMSNVCFMDDPEAEGHAESRRLLVIAEEATTADLAKDVLQHYGFGVSAHVIATIPPAIDTSGYDVILPEIRNRHPGAFVILWTGCSLTESFIAGLVGELFAILQKPNDHWEMIHLVRLARTWPGSWKP